MLCVSHTHTYLEYVIQQNISKDINQIVVVERIIYVVQMHTYSLHNKANVINKSTFTMEEEKPSENTGGSTEVHECIYRKLVDIYIMWS